jgi:hypothetical protein
MTPPAICCCAVLLQTLSWGCKSARAQVGGGTQDHASYLLPRGAADVFFPTNFRMLGRLYEAAARAAPSPLTGACHLWFIQRCSHLETKEIVLLTCFASKRGSTGAA